MKKTDQKKLLALGCFGLLALLIWGVKTQASWLSAFDNAGFKLLGQPQTAVNTAIFKLVTALASPAVSLGLGAVLCLAFWYFKKRDLSIWLAFVQLFGAALAFGLKFAVRRLRPAHQLMPDSGFSFPSGHTFCAAILVLCLLAALWPLLHDQEIQLLAIIAGVLWIALVSVARIYLRDHFPTDILASIFTAVGYWQLTALAAPKARIWLHQFLIERRFE